MPASCGEWGGTIVDKACRQFLEDIFGSSVLERFENDPDNSIDYYEFWQNFEVKKRDNRNSKTSNKISLIVPLLLTEIVKDKGISSRNNEIVFKRIKILRYGYI